MARSCTALVLFLSMFVAGCGEEVPELWVSTRSLEFKHGIQTAHFVILNSGGGSMDVQIHSAVVNIPTPRFTLTAGTERVVAVTLKPEVVQASQGVVDGQILVSAALAGHETIQVSSDVLPAANDPDPVEPDQIVGGTVRGLVGYWPLNGNGHDGVLLEGAELTASDGAPVPGDVGCASFPGVAGNAMDCSGGSDVQITSDVTLMAWVNPTDSGRTQFAAGVPYDDGPEWDEPWVGVRGGAMATWFNVINAEGNAKDREYDSGSTVANEWQHLAFTFDGNVAISYVNGDEVVAHDDRDGEIGYEGDPHFTIGERSLTAVDEPFGGLVDEVALFDRVLSATEVRKAMENGVLTGVAAGPPGLSGGLGGLLSSEGGTPESSMNAWADARRGD